MAAKPIIAHRFATSRIHRDTEWLDEFAVLYAGGARRFAGAAIEAQFEVMANAIVQLQFAVGNAAHKVNTAARAFVLVARFHVRRTCRRTEAAVYAVE